MVKRVLFLLLAVWPCFAIAQKPVAEKMLSEYILAAGDYSALYQGEIEPMFSQSSWTTHPYWNDADVHVGDVCYEGRLYKNVNLRYNLLENRLYVISIENRYSVAPVADKVSFFIMDGKIFFNTGKTYSCIEYGGRCVSLVHERIKKYAGDLIVDRSAIRNIETDDIYHLVYADGRVVEISNVRSIIKNNPKYKAGLKKMMWEYNIKGRNDSQNVMAMCVRHLDEAMTQNGESHSEGISAEIVIPSQLGQLELSSAPQQQSVPSDVFDDVDSDTTSVLAYEVYSLGNKAEANDFEEYYASEEPGIDDMEPIKETHTLDEVEVIGFMQKINSIQAGLDAFRPQMLRNIPLAMGEADVMKVTMMMPGVTSTGEASSGINVRGGATDQNQMLYNGNTVFYPMHMFGLFSAFNTDMVAETELYKGSMPSQYGGRLSSVMNIKGRVADKNHWHGSISIGLLTAKATFEIPLVKGKTSMILGGRTTYSDWMLNLLSGKENKSTYGTGGSGISNVNGYKDGNAGFWDLSTFISSKLSEKSTLLLSGYISSDRFSFNGKDEYNYRNINASAEYKTYHSEDLSTSIIGGLDHFDYSNLEKESSFSEAELSFKLNQYFLKANMSYSLNGIHTLKGGIQVQDYNIMPGKYEPKGAHSKVEASQLDDDMGIESGAYVEDAWELSPEMKLSGGVRLNMFNGLREGKTKNYFNPDVRLSASYSLNENSSVKAAFITSHQYIHKVSNTVIMSPTDTWLLSNKNIKPQSGYQISTGYYMQTNDKTYEISGEVYYKRMSNYLTYRAGSQLIMNNDIENDVAPAKGRAYGVELQVKKLYGKFNGWVSYTYSRTQLQQKGNKNISPINDGEWFSADYDTPHILKVAANFKFTHRYSASVNADYSTGRPFTAPVGTFFDESQGKTVALYSDRNNYRMPYYFRVDLSLNVEPSHKLTRKTKSWFSMGVYNILGRKNPYSIYSEGGYGNIKTYKLSIFGAPIPFISYNIKF